MFFKIEEIRRGEIYYDYIILNKKIMLCIDCSMSLNLSIFEPNNPNNMHTESLTTLKAAQLLGCIVRDIEYDDAYGSGMTWKMPTYILLEKNGFQLEVKKSYDDNSRPIIEWETKKLLHNNKTKHTNKQ